MDKAPVVRDSGQHNGIGLTAALFRDSPVRRNLVLWIGLVLAGAGLGGLAAGGARVWLLAVVPGLAALVFAVVDLTQTEHSLRRTFPGAARARWFFESLRPFARSYLVEGDLDGRPFSHEERDLVYARAHGSADAHPFGTELDVYSGEYEWLAHSMLPNPDADAAMRGSVGSSQCAKP